MTIHHATVTKAEARSITLEEGFLNGTANVTATWAGPEEISTTIAPKAKDALAAMVEIQEQAQADAEDDAHLEDINATIFGEPEEAATTGSVVKAVYKDRYTTNGTKGRGNGDPLYEWCLNKFGTGERFDIEALEATADANGVTHEQYKRTGTGWEGRLRMTIGIKLRTLISNGETLKNADGTDAKIDPDWCAQMAQDKADKLTKRKTKKSTKVDDKQAA